MNNKVYQRVAFFAPVVIIGFSVIIRFLWLDIDPPLFFRGISQDLMTDPYNITHFARNKILWGEWEIFGYDRWILFKYSLVSLFSYLAFLIGGVSRVTANLAATFLSLGGLVLFAAAYRGRPGRPGLIVAMLLLINMSLMVYGRYPFLENGLIFICGLIFYLMIRHYEHGWLPVAVGILTAAAIMMGKMFGLIIGLPVAVLFLNDGWGSFLKRYGMFVVSFLVATAFLSWLFYGSAQSILYNYISEQTVGMYGFPRSLTSPFHFIKMFLTFGGDSRLYYYSPFLLPLILLSLVSLVFLKNAGAAIRKNRYLIFNLTWFLGGFALLMLFNYRPMRYQLFLIPPLIGVIAEILIRPIARKEVLITPRRLVAVFVMLWYTMVQISIMIYLYTGNQTFDTRMVWMILPLAALIVVVLIYLFRRHLRRLVPRVGKAMVVLVALYILMQIGWFYKWADHRSSSLKQMGADLTQILNDDAVIGGPYSQAVTIDNDLRSFIYMFGLKRQEPDLFKRFPVTHFASDISNWELAEKDFPGMSLASPVARYWIRDVEVAVIRADDSALGRPPTGYTRTYYEKAMDFFNSRQHGDSLYYYLTRFLNRHRENKAGLLLLANYFMAANKTDMGFKIYDKLTDLYPDDFWMYFEKARASYVFHRVTGKQIFLIRSEHYFDLALELNPYIARDIDLAKIHSDSIAAARYR